MHPSFVRSALRRLVSGTPLSLFSLPPAPARAAVPVVSTVVRPTRRSPAPSRAMYGVTACALAGAVSLAPGAPLPAERIADAAAPSSSAMRYLQSTLHVQPEVAACVAALSRAIRANARYDRLVQLDRYVIRARVRRAESIFSIAQPVGIDTRVVIKGSARIRRQWAWRPVVTRCGLKAGRVVAIAITPRDMPAHPAARPGQDADGAEGGATHRAATTA